MTALENCKLDSGEQEHAWFGLAHIGGPATLDSMLAIQVLTFQKEKDGLPGFTPPPEDVLPCLKELTRTIGWRCGGMPWATPQTISRSSARPRR